MTPLHADPMFYAFAIPAVILVGLSKGGLGGAFALIAIPIMVLAVPPLQAAAIMLPILIVMDIASLWVWRGKYNSGVLRAMLPGGLAGIAAGWAMAAYVTDSAVKLVVGIISIAFVLRWLWQRWKAEEIAARPNGAKATFWSVIAGFTSFVAHAGGPPFQVYALPLRLDPGIFVGTSVIFFSVVNAVKLIPYFALGQFSNENLIASVLLIPIAPVATFAGAWVVRRMDAEVFYPVMYAMIALVGLKLVYDGLV